jgi:hypothetical protein
MSNGILGVYREMAWNGLPQRVRAPYFFDALLTRDDTRVPRDTRNLVGIWEDHLLRLNTRRHR